MTKRYIGVIGAAKCGVSLARLAEEVGRASRGPDGSYGTLSEIGFALKAGKR